LNVIASSPVTDRDDSLQRLDRLSDLARDLLARAHAQGASQAEVSCDEDRGLNVNVRMGAVESVESTRDRSIGVTVYFDRRKGSASTADLRPESLEATVAQACAIARHTEDDPAAGLADAGRMATDLREFDSWHPWALDADAAIDLALTCETAGRDVDTRIANSDGTSVSTGESISVYANSHGFLGRERDTHHTIACGLIAGRGADMQSGHRYTFALARGDLEAPEAVGRRAAERALARLAPRSLATGTMPVLFQAEAARSLIGHLVNAVSGGALYRGASFLLNSVGTRVLPVWCHLSERPFLMRGMRSSAFDAEGVATRESDLVRDGVLQRYVLGSYSARKLGLQSTGNAGGIFNLEVAANAGGLDDLVRSMGTGLLVTELMGHGVNTTTGDYSRGAAGFYVENGQIAYPVDGITIAGNLRAMLQGIEAIGADVDPRSHLHCGSILLGGMTVAGGV
jgi:PmbA protein